MLSYYACGLAYMALLCNVLLPGVDDIGLKELLTVWFLSSVGPDLVIGAFASLLAWRRVPVVKRLQAGQN